MMSSHPHQAHLVSTPTSASSRGHSPPHFRRPNSLVDESSPRVMPEGGRFGLRRRMHSFVLSPDSTGGGGSGLGSPLMMFASGNNNFFPKRPTTAKLHFARAVAKFHASRTDISGKAKLLRVITAFVRFKKLEVHWKYTSGQWLNYVAGLTSYLPQTCREAVVTHQKEGSFSYEDDGAVVFADVSGYSKLAELLDSTSAKKETMWGGRSESHSSCELVRDILSSYFSLVMEGFMNMGGDVIKVAGDGIMIFWSSKNQPLAQAAEQAIRAVVKVTSRFSNFNSQGYQLSLHAGVAVGHVCFHVVGGIERWFFVPTGVAIRDATTAANGELGTVVLSESALPYAEKVVETSLAVLEGEEPSDRLLYRVERLLVEDDFPTTPTAATSQILHPSSPAGSAPWEIGRSVSDSLTTTTTTTTTTNSGLFSHNSTVLNTNSNSSSNNNFVNSGSVNNSSNNAGTPVAGAVSTATPVTGGEISTPLPPAPPTEGWNGVVESKLRAFLHEAVVDHIRTFVTQKVAELRWANVLFLKIDLDTNMMECNQARAVLHDACTAMQSVVRRLEGSIKEFGVDDKGTVLVAGFGVPPFSHADDNARAVLAAIELRQALLKLNLNCFIGLATGWTFCGTIGKLRREYAIVGAVVNLAARLMMAGYTRNAPILCTAEMCTAIPNINFHLLDIINVKGRAQSVTVFEPIYTSGNSGMNNTGSSSPLFINSPTASGGGQLIVETFTGSAISNSNNNNNNGTSNNNNNNATNGGGSGGQGGQGGGISSTSGFFSPNSHHPQGVLTPGKGGGNSRSSRVFPREIALLTGCILSAIRRKRGLGIFIEGGHGVGKSRLVTELAAHSPEMDNARVVMIKAWSERFFSSEDYSIWGRVVLTILGLSETDSPKVESAFRARILQLKGTVDDNVLQVILQLFQDHSFRQSNRGMMDSISEGGGSDKPSVGSSQNNNNSHGGDLNPVVVADAVHWLLSGEKIILGFDDGQLMPDCSWEVLYHLLKRGCVFCVAMQPLFMLPEAFKEMRDVAEVWSEDIPQRKHKSFLLSSKAPYHTMLINVKTMSILAASDLVIDVVHEFLCTQAANNASAHSTNHNNNNNGGNNSGSSSPASASPLKQRSLSIGGLSAVNFAVHSLVSSPIAASNPLPTSCDLSVAGFLHERTQGIPLFVRDWALELCKADCLIVEKGRIQFRPQRNYGRNPRPPPCVQSEIASVKDDLDPAQVLTLQVCSVMGKVIDPLVMFEVFPFHKLGWSCFSSFRRMSLMVIELNKLVRRGLLGDSPHPDSNGPLDILSSGRGQQHRSSGSRLDALRDTSNDCPSSPVLRSWSTNQMWGDSNDFDTPDSLRALGTNTPTLSLYRFQWLLLQDVILSQISASRRRRWCALLAENLSARYVAVKNMEAQIQSKKALSPRFRLLAMPKWGSEGDIRGIGRFHPHPTSSSVSGNNSSLSPGSIKENPVMYASGAIKGKRADSRITESSISILPRLLNFMAMSEDYKRANEMITEAPRGYLDEWLKKEATEIFGAHDANDRFWFSIHISLVPWLKFLQVMVMTRAHINFHAALWAALAAVRFRGTVVRVRKSSADTSGGASGEQERSPLLRSKRYSDRLSSGESTPRCPSPHLRSRSTSLADEESRAEFTRAMAMLSPMFRADSDHQMSVDVSMGLKRRVAGGSAVDFSLSPRGGGDASPRRAGALFPAFPSRAALGVNNNNNNDGDDSTDNDTDRNNNDDNDTDDVENDGDADDGDDSDDNEDAILKKSGLAALTRDDRRLPASPSLMMRHPHVLAPGLLKRSGSETHESVGGGAGESPISAMAAAAAIRFQTSSGIDSSVLLGSGQNSPRVSAGGGSSSHQSSPRTLYPGLASTSPSPKGVARNLSPSPKGLGPAAAAAGGGGTGLPASSPKDGSASSGSPKMWGGNAFAAVSAGRVQNVPVMLRRQAQMIVPSAAEDDSKKEEDKKNDGEKDNEEEETSEDDEALKAAGAKRIPRSPLLGRRSAAAAASRDLRSRVFRPAPLAVSATAPSNNSASPAASITKLRPGGGPPPMLQRTKSGGRLSMNSPQMALRVMVASPTGEVSRNPHKLVMGAESPVELEGTITIGSNSSSSLVDALQGGGGGAAAAGISDDNGDSKTQQHAEEFLPLGCKIRQGSGSSTVETTEMASSVEPSEDANKGAAVEEESSQDVSKEISSLPEIAPSPVILKDPLPRRKSGANFQELSAPMEVEDGHTKISVNLFSSAASVRVTTSSQEITSSNPGAELPTGSFFPFPMDSIISSRQRSSSTSSFLVEPNLSPNEVRRVVQTVDQVDHDDDDDDDNDSDDNGNDMLLGSEVAKYHHHHHRQHQDTPRDDNNSGAESDSQSCASCPPAPCGTPCNNPRSRSGSGSGNAPSSGTSSRLVSTFIWSDATSDTSSVMENAAASSHVVATVNDAFNNSGSSSNQYSSAAFRRQDEDHSSSDGGRGVNNHVSSSSQSPASPFATLPTSASTIFQTNLRSMVDRAPTDEDDTEDDRLPEQYVFSDAATNCTGRATPESTRNTPMSECFVPLSFDDDGNSNNNRRASRDDDAFADAAAAAAARPPSSSASSHSSQHADDDATDTTGNNNGSASVRTVDGERTARTLDD